MLALDSQYSNRKRRFSFAIDQATLVKPGSNHNVGLTWKSIISVHLTVKFLYLSDLIFNLSLGWLWSWKAGKGWEMWVWLYNSLHFKHPTISPLQAPRAKRLRKSGRFVTEIFSAAKMAKRLFTLLLTFLAAVCGDADPWLDNELYYGTVFQVIQDFRANPCSANMIVGIKL